MNLESARAKLAAVPDPEIPAVTLVDLGIVRDLRETASGVEVVLTPTYSGCPATELIADDVRAALAEFGDVTVTLRRAPAWSTDWITPAGREKLQQYGIVPPQCSAEQAIRIVPRLRSAFELSEAQTDAMLIHTPRRLLAVAAGAGA